MMRSVRENVSLPWLAARPFTRFGFLDRGSERSKVHDLADRLNLQPRNIEHDLERLSGGNQQKVLISRWLLTVPDLLILDEPTRGIDVGAKSEIYRLMTEFVRSGKAIIMISSELPEVLGMSDRILVMHEGDKVVLSDMSRWDNTDRIRLQD